LGNNSSIKTLSEIKKESNSIFKLNFFESKNLKIKKIVSGGIFSGFSIFLTGCFVAFKNIFFLIFLKNILKTRMW
jgi:hypothetical protein